MIIKTDSNYKTTNCQSIVFLHLLFFLQLKISHRIYIYNWVETLFEQSFAWFFSVDHLHVRLHHSVALSLNMQLFCGEDTIYISMQQQIVKQPNKQLNKQANNNEMTKKKYYFSFTHSLRSSLLLNILCVWKESKKSSRIINANVLTDFLCLYILHAIQSQMWTKRKNSWWRWYSCWCFGDECIFKILRNKNVDTLVKKNDTLTTVWQIKL